MQLQTVLLGLLATSSVQALDFSFGQQATLTDELEVPGDNPLVYCQDPQDDILAIKFVDLSPNPPEAGKTLSIDASGILSKEIKEGAKAHLQVKYGLITLINQEADLCESLKKVDKECPLEKGKLDFKKDIDLPAQIPPGHYSVLANVTTVDGESITCLKASIQFGRH